MKASFLFQYLFGLLVEFKNFIQSEAGAIGVTPPAILPAQSQLLGFDSELRMKSLLQSIYTDVKGHYNAETKKMSAGIYMEISNAALSKSHTATITMALHLRAAGVMGNAVAIGSEELITTKAATIYRNNCRKVVANPEYGVRKLDQDYLNLRKTNVDNLGVWNQDEEDLEIHQGLLETYGETLYWGDTAAICVPNWNANMFVAGLGSDFSQQPVYSANPATYTNRIVAAILASGNGSFAPIPNQTLNQPNLSNLSNFALSRRIARLPIPGAPGGKGFILSVSEHQAMYLGDPVWSARNLGSLWIQFNNLNEKVQNWSGALGMYKDMLVVVDHRFATVLPAGTSEPYSMTSGYMWHGDTDRRNLDNPFVRDVCVLHGNGAVWKWYPEKIHFIEQYDDYGAIKGIGTACVRGIGSLVYDQQTPAAGTQEQFSSVICLCSRPDYR
jgi:hypothetical protein